jgi:hypothetical protein
MSLVLVLITFSLGVDSLVSLTPVVYESCVTLYNGVVRGGSESQTKEEDLEPETSDRLVPSKVVFIGSVGSIIIGTIAVSVVFGMSGIKPWATFIGFLMGGLLSILG